jgi:serine/threonine protein kinase HipA of HipAB toxin-antitoxin module
MSKDTPGGGTPAPSADALTADIERTRQELGETVEALVAKADVKARAQHRAAEVAGDLRARARTAIGKARDGARGAKEKVAEHAPAAQAMRGVRVYSIAAAAGTALLLAWLTVRRRRR